MNLIPIFFVEKFWQLNRRCRQVVGRAVEAVTVDEEQLDDGGVQNFVVDAVGADAHAREGDLSDGQPCGWIK